MIHVVAGAVIDAKGLVLIAQRLPGKHLAGGWEFPGGKLEPGEQRTHGLARELREELGIEVRDPRPLLRLRHTYPYGEVLIDMWVVSRCDGAARGMEGQALRWCTPEELAAAQLLPADQPIVRALRLPERLGESRTPFFEVYEGAVPSGSDDGRLHGVYTDTVAAGAAAAGAGADFIVLRPDLAGFEVAALCNSVNVPVYVRGRSPEAAFRLGATGVHSL